MNLQNWLKTLLTLAIALPIVHCVLIWVRGLVASMGDEAGATVVGHVGTACLAIWAASLVGLVIVLAVQSIIENEGED
jgi:hypothetical protein